MIFGILQLVFSRDFVPDVTSNYLHFHVHVSIIYFNWQHFCKANFKQHHFLNDELKIYRKQIFSNISCRGIQKNNKTFIQNCIGALKTSCKSKLFYLLLIDRKLFIFATFYFVKNVRIWSFSGSYFLLFSISPYSVRMRENTDQKNSKYSYFSRSVHELIYSERSLPSKPMFEQRWMYTWRHNFHLYLSTAVSRKQVWR